MELDGRLALRAKALLFESRGKYLHLFLSPSVCFEVRLKRDVAESRF
jgi:hypothetical protein